jgi:hypothetical protein
MDDSAKPLRILVIVNLPWDSRLGASRVWMELADQWTAAGHTVEKFSLSDAFPGVRASRITFALRQIAFIRKAAAFVRKNGDRFDVIDALIGTLPFSRHELGFAGSSWRDRWGFIISTTSSTRACSNAGRARRRGSSPAACFTDLRAAGSCRHRSALCAPPI